MNKQVMTSVQVRLPDSVHQDLKQIAKEQDRSTNWIINRILEKAVAEKRGEKQ